MLDSSQYRRIPGAITNLLEATWWVEQHLWGCWPWDWRSQCEVGLRLLFAPEDRESEGGEGVSDAVGCWAKGRQKKWGGGLAFCVFKVGCGRSPLGHKDCRPGRGEKDDSLAISMR